LCTNEILEKLKTEENIDKLNDRPSNKRLEFSLNYFLDRNEKFALIHNSTPRWDLLKPSAYVHMTINEKTFINGHLCVLSDLDNLLFYHSFIDKGIFSFPYDRCISAVYDSVKQVLFSKEFEDELTKLSDEKEFKVRFEQPEQRGGLIRICPTSDKLDEDGKVQSTVTIREDWIDKGIIIVPKRISNYMEGTNTIHIIYDQVDKVLPYWGNEGRIEGLEDFYSVKNVAEFDKVYLRLEGLEPTRLFITATWQRSLDKLLSIEPRDLDWKHSSLRDCIIVILAKFKTPMHYREIYAEIAIHRNVSVVSIDATLSRYSPRVFVRAGSGKWGLAGWMSEELPGGGDTGDRPPSPEPDENIWKIVQLIEENDYVYKLLQKTGRPLSFSDICDKLANVLKVDSDKLKATGFLKASDERLRRLDDGTWALEEWYKKPIFKEEQKEVELSESKGVTEPIISADMIKKRNSSQLFLAILLILFFLFTIGGIILFCLFI
ncbi:MAG: hypothetical protein WCZ17_09905, partial [Candidatus Kapaibacterium sp.]